MKYGPDLLLYNVVYVLSNTECRAVSVITYTCELVKVDSCKK